MRFSRFLFFLEISKYAPKQGIIIIFREVARV